MSNPQSFRQRRAFCYKLKKRKLQGLDLTATLIDMNGHSKEQVRCRT